MTYDEKHLPPLRTKWMSCVDGRGQLCKRDVQLFMKRLRKENAKYVDRSLRYYTVGEYGTETMRPHYHSIMFNLHEDLVARLTGLWEKGHVMTGTVTPASIHYVTKYVINRVQDFRGREPPFSLMSRRPGIGSSYLETHTGWHREGKRNFTLVNGVMARLPRYYKDKMFNSIERMRMAQELVPVTTEAYLEEIERLCDQHHDAFAYYEERYVYNHDQIVSKVNSLNKF